MCVPPGAFGGTTPERKASELLAAMMTHIACWIVIDQTETTAPRISVREDGARILKKLMAMARDEEVLR